MIELKRITEEELSALWAVAFKETAPAWVEWDAPYLHTYRPLSFKEFLREEARFFLSPEVKGIYLEQKLIGAVSYYWENRASHWLEEGIVLFQAKHWGQGYGTQALALWNEDLFERFPRLPRVGFTTWSKNQGMIGLGQKLNYQPEARLRQVILYQGERYDSIRMGLLRSEWEDSSKSINR